MVELESNGEMARTDVAAFLREFADELAYPDERVPADGGSLEPVDDGRGVDVAEKRGDAGRSDDDGQVVATRQDGVEPAAEPRQITFIGGGDSATVTVPDTVAFDVEIDSRSPLLTSGDKQELTFELSWRVDAAHDDDTIDLV